MKDHEPVIDSLPGYFDYSDKGCGFFPSCLECPLPHCRHDNIYAGGRNAFRLRNEEISVRYQKGETIAELAESFRLHKRTVQRIVARQRK